MTKYNWRSVSTAVLAVFVFGSTLFAQTIRVDISRPVNTLVPTQALGAGIDRMPSAAVEKYFNQPALGSILAAGWQTVSYRQNTELAVEAWHWNPNGTWSDPAGKGYFTGNATPGEPILHSYGYLLPHRGFTRNEGTETHGFSRMTDGDLNTYWKSNPYLTKSYTGQDDSAHPQWVVLDLAMPQMINALRIAWAEPYARQYVVQYWTGDEAVKQPTKGAWVTFPSGSVENGKGGTETLTLTPNPMSVRFIRIWMTVSSNTCDSHGSADPRNCVGYAIRELSLGIADQRGFHDLVRHTPDQDQTTTFCSSIDPWHEPSDLGSASREHVGLDAFYKSGYTRGLPAMIPIAMLYGIPEDAAAEIAYLEKRGYPISYVEMGEEPDGQYTLPEDDAELYIQFAAALHKVDPALKLGGPVFTGQNEDILAWPDAQGRISWTGRFVDYLKSRGHLQDLAFFSFEHYPYEPCKISWSNLYDEPMLMSHILQVWRNDGVPTNVPMFVTESNITWNTGESSVDIFGALWLADYVGSFFASGGNALYYFHYLPLGVHQGCNDSMGTFGMYTTSKTYDIEKPTSQFFASQLINTEWVQPGNELHKIFAASGDISDTVGHSLITAYALQRPDGQWSLMLVNRDQENAHKVHIVFEGGENMRAFTGAVSIATFGSAQYQWQPARGAPEPDGPVMKSSIPASADTWYELPKASMTVMRGLLTSPASRPKNH
jgi:F5/8 type C domain-containing protein